jgi:hypothetical protein
MQALRRVYNTELGCKVFEVIGNRKFIDDLPNKPLPVLDFLKVYHPTLVDHTLAGKRRIDAELAKSK